MRLGVHIPCFRLTHFLPAVLQSVKHLDSVLVTNSRIPWDGGEESEDNTREICEKSGLVNLELISGAWDSPEYVQRNMALDLLMDCDFVYLLDSDEIMTLGEQKRLLEFALDHPEYDGFAVNSIPYFGDLEHVALYDVGHTPLALVRPKARFFITRCIENPWVHCMDVSMHHLKFLQPRRDVLWRKTAKDNDQQRAFRGVKKVEKNLELESFMASCGYTKFSSEIDESEIGIA